MLWFVIAEASNFAYEILKWIVAEEFSELSFDGESGWIDKNLELRKKKRKSFLNSLQVFRSKFLFSPWNQRHYSTDLCLNFSPSWPLLSSTKPKSFQQPRKKWRRQSYQYMSRNKRWMRRLSRGATYSHILMRWATIKCYSSARVGNSIIWRLSAAIFRVDIIGKIFKVIVSCTCYHTQTSCEGWTECNLPAKVSLYW